MILMSCLSRFGLSALWIKSFQKEGGRIHWVPREASFLHDLFQLPGVLLRALTWASNRWQVTTLDTRWPAQPFQQANPPSDISMYRVGSGWPSMPILPLKKKILVYLIRFSVNTFICTVKKTFLCFNTIGLKCIAINNLGVSHFKKKKKKRMKHKENKQAKGHSDIWMPDGISLVMGLIQ